MFEEAHEDQDNWELDDAEDFDRVPSTGIQALDNKVADWMRWDKNSTSRSVIRMMVFEGLFHDLERVLYNRLQFGSGGLRGEMGAGFACMNDLVVIQTNQGLLKYLEDTVCCARDRGVLVGYDGRHNSRRFAELTVTSCVVRGFKAYMFPRCCATPFVAFGVRSLKCSAGVMITGSHNPKTVNGMKIFLQNAVQVVEPHDVLIQESIMENLIPWHGSWKTEYSRVSNVINPMEEVLTDYVGELIRTESSFRNFNESSTLRVVYTPLHGVGHEFMTMAFKVVKLKNFICVDEQMDAHPEFPTLTFPNPEESCALSCAIKTANKYNCTVILANDPDADRLAVAEKLNDGEWKKFSGNELGALLGWWLLHLHIEKYGRENLQRCVMISSTASSRILKTMAEAEGFTFVETPIGFKWIGNKACDLSTENYKVLFAFEESAGYMCGASVFDKDGIGAGIRVVEMANYLKSEGLNLTEKLETIYEQYGYHISLKSSYLFTVPDVIKCVFRELRHFGDPNSEAIEYPSSVLQGKHRVVSIKDWTTGYTKEAPLNPIPNLPLCSRQMITFGFNNGIEITLRSSDSEPRIKYYAELKAHPEAKYFKDAMKPMLYDVVDAILKEWVQTDKWSLLPTVEIPVYVEEEVVDAEWDN